MQFIKEHASNKALTIDGIPEKGKTMKSFSVVNFLALEYDYDEIVAASEEEIDEIIEGNSNQHDEL